MSINVVKNEEHMTKIHEVAIKKENISIKHECNLCGNEFETPYLLKKHADIHKESLRIKCNFCNKNVFKYRMKQHVQSVHEKIRNHVCPAPGCKAKFSQKCSIKRHVIRMHKQQVKNFMCD